MLRAPAGPDGLRPALDESPSGVDMVVLRPAPAVRLLLGALVLFFSVISSLAFAPRSAVGTEQVVVNGRTYDAYIPTATKEGQFEHYTCEFDAAWVVLETFGINLGLAEMLAIVGHDTSIEPYYQQTANGIVIYGGDVTTAFSGNYADNFLARTTGTAMWPLFEDYGLDVSRVQDREQIERALEQGKLIWIKTTVDFQPWTPATWVMPDGDSYQTVLGNDHAVVIMGYNDQGVVIRDVLGPTSSNWNRVYEYEVDWDTFLWAWGSHGKDGLAVGRPIPEGDGTGIGSVAVE
ncbi:MAG: C39 family peptidase [Thermomicrobiales bacterium]